MSVPSQNPGEKLYDPFLDGNFSKEVCFLCGTKLSASNRTREHIFPQWLLRHFNLTGRSAKNTTVNFHGKDLHFTNYSKILIPCCKSCNSTVLAPIEKRLKKDLLLKNAKDFDLSPSDLFIWIAKVFYGYYLDEHLRGKIDITRFLELPGYSGIRTIFLFLQSVRFQFLMRGSFFFEHAKLPGMPVSAFIFDVKLDRDVSRQFDYIDDFSLECVYLRLGKKAILLAFDGGYVHHHAYDYFSKYLDKLLHPKQAEELAARFFHVAGLKKDVFRFTKYEENHLTVLDYDAGLLPINWSALRDRLPFIEQDEESSQRYEFLLSRFTRQPIKGLTDGKGNVHSWLRGADGEFLDIDIDKYPFG
ncbi:hypothetical protein [Chryseolinea soli]|nr:hypothetical protein [Chryseolinea soli]